MEKGKFLSMGEGKRIKAAKVVVTSILFLMLTIVGTATAAGQGNLEADDVQYYREQNLVKAAGNVHLTTEEIELWADKLEMDLAANKLVARGQVRSKNDTGEFTSQKLTYDLNLDEGLFIDSEGILVEDSFREPMHIKMPRAVRSKDQTKLEKPRFTTCNFSEPHYHFQAKDMTIYPEDKIIAYHVTFWEFNGRVPLFYTPIWIYSLKDEEQNLQTQFGHNKQKGWFVKNTYNYELPTRPDNGLLQPLGGEFGQLYLDYFTKLGYAGGFKHYYKTLEDNNAYLDLYVEQDKRNKEESPWVTLEWAGEREQDDLDRSYSLTYKDHYSDYLSNPEQNTWLEVELDQTNTGSQWEKRWVANYDRNESYDNRYDLDFTLEKLNWGRDDLEIDLDYLREEEPDSWSNEYGGEVDYTKYLTDDLSLSYDYNYDQTRTQAEDVDWDYDTTLTLEEDKQFYDWRLATTLDRNQDRINFYNLPEAEVTLHPGEISDFEPISPLNVSFGGLNRYHHTWVERKQHGYYNLNYSDYLQLGSPTHKLNYDQKFQQDFYSEGYLHWFYESELTLTNNLANWKNELTHNYLTDQGLVPSGFSRKDPKNKLEEKLTWRQGKSEFSLTTGYDLQDQLYDDLVSSLTYEFNSHYRLEADTTYDLNNKEFDEEFTTSLRTTYNDFKYTTKTQLDLNTGQLKRWNNNLTWRTGEDKQRLRLNLNTSYDYQQERFRTANLQLEKELHCRKIIVSYDHVKEETWFEYQIMAFPQNGLSFGAQRGEGLQMGGEVGETIDEAN
jgi:LPS-assembly protein